VTASPQQLTKYIKIKTINYNTKVYLLTISKSNVSAQLTIYTITQTPDKNKQQTTIKKKQRTTKTPNITAQTDQSPSNKEKV